jgi:hypothetical protein
MNLTTSYKNYSYLLTENPRTSLAWNQTSITNLEIGVECNSPAVSGSTVNLTLRPNGDGDTIEFLRWTTADYNYLNVDEISHDDNTTRNYSQVYSYKLDLYTLEDSAQTEVITAVTVYAWMFEDNNHTQSKYKMAIKTNGTIFYGTETKTPPSRYRLCSYTWLINPATSSAWTWTNINNLQAGVAATTYSGRTWLTQVYVVVSYTLLDFYPEIRTTQMYAQINYDYLETATLPIPDEISSNHSRNVNMLNFWNGEREVYSISRSNKTLVLRGMDWSDTSCTDMLAVRTMGKNGDDVTLSGLNMYIFNDDYKICSFGWKEINQNPPHYEWILQLEYVD